MAVAQDSNADLDPQTAETTTNESPNELPVASDSDLEDQATTQTAIETPVVADQVVADDVTVAQGSSVDLDPQTTEPTTNELQNDSQVASDSDLESQTSTQVAIETPEIDVPAQAPGEMDSDVGQDVIAYSSQNKADDQQAKKEESVESDSENLALNVSPQEAATHVVPEAVDAVVDHDPAVLVAEDQPTENDDIAQTTPVSVGEESVIDADPRSTTQSSVQSSVQSPIQEISEVEVDQDFQVVANDSLTTSKADSTSEAKIVDNLSNSSSVSIDHDDVPTPAADAALLGAVENIQSSSDTKDASRATDPSDAILEDAPIEASEASGERITESQAISKQDQTQKSSPVDDSVGAERESITETVSQDDASPALVTINEPGIDDSRIVASDESTSAAIDTQQVEQGSQPVDEVVTDSVTQHHEDISDQPSSTIGSSSTDGQDLESDSSFTQSQNTLDEPLLADEQAISTPVAIYVE